MLYLRRYAELTIDKATAQGLDENDNGKLFTGTKIINGTTYEFGSDGILVKMDSIIPDTQKYIIHIIASGDTLWDLARKNKCTVAEIVSLNAIKNPSNVAVGTQIKIPKK